MNENFLQDSQSSTVKKPKNEKGVVAFSQIKTASIVRVKKPNVVKPSSNKEENTSLAGKSSESSTSGEVTKELAGSRKGASVTNESNEKTSLSLLGNYDSSSNSDDSD